jgi:endoglycosylceramidase
MYWSYNGHLVTDSTQPLAPPNLNLAVLGALARPYPTVVNGTPTRLGFEATSSTMDFEYTTARPDGRPASRFFKTVISVPKLRYPSGYAVTAVGADVTSRPCANAVTLRNRSGAASVSVKIVPASVCH